MKLLDYDVLEQLINEKKFKEFRSHIEDSEEIDIAKFIESLSETNQILAFRSLPKDVASDVFSFVSFEVQQNIVLRVTDKEISSIIEDLYIDDAVDMLDELPASVVKKILQNVTEETRSLINQYLKYDENSAGSIMTAEFVDLKKNMNVYQAIERIRKVGNDKESIYTCYVIDENRHLEGVVSVKDLLLSKNDILVGEIMDDNYVCATTTDDKEEVANLLSRYDLLALPIVDNEKRLVGIVTIDDAVDVLTQEASEDIQIMGALTPTDKAYLNTGVFSMVKHRILWLILLMISGTITGLILGKFEAAISVLPLLVTFIPMLNDTGGNCGAQSSTLVIRGLSTGELTPKDWLKIWFKEFRVALIVSIILALLNFIRIIITYPKTDNIYMIATAVCLSLVLVIIIAKSIGGLLPLLAKKLKLDPAVMAAPLITTLVDCAAILVYFALAMSLIPQLG